jgi:peptide chain release factor subunit 1
MPSTESLTAQLGRLAEFEPVPFPVISLYLNTQPGQHGRDQHQAFIRKEFKARSRTYDQRSSERESLDRDLERISRYLETELQPSSNSVAIFACSAGDLFETVQMAAPIDLHWLHIGDRPHLYPLARLESQYPRYAAVVTDTNSARILVFAAGAVVGEHEINNVKTRSTSQGGWSQARYQRHIGNFHQQHAKEVVDALDRIVRAENIQHVVLSCDEVSLQLLKAQMPKHLEDRIVDNVKLEAHAPADAIVRGMQEAMQRLNERTDREKVEAAVGAYRGGGLGVVGPEDTLAALLKGQVDELLITASMQQMQAVPIGQTIGSANDAVLAEPAVQTASAGEAAESAPEVVRLADELIAKATQTAAKITFVEDPELLKDYGGVAALLRFTI